MLFKKNSASNYLKRQIGPSRTNEVYLVLNNYEHYFSWISLQTMLLWINKTTLRPLYYFTEGRQTHMILACFILGYVSPLHDFQLGYCQKFLFLPISGNFSIFRWYDENVKKKHFFKGLNWKSDWKDTDIDGQLLFMPYYLFRPLKKLLFF